MVGQHHRFNGHELGQTPGEGEGQGGLACCSPWGHKELDMTWQLANNKKGRGAGQGEEGSHTTESPGEILSLHEGPSGPL